MNRILLAGREDLPAILRLQKLAYQSEAKLVGRAGIPPLRQTLEELEAEYETGVLLKAEDETGALIGSVRLYTEKGTAHIGKLMVHPGRQKQGLGTRLLREAERAAPAGRYELFTSVKSAANLRLYQREGYRPFREETLPAGLRLVFLQKFRQEKDR